MELLYFPLSDQDAYKVTLLFKYLNKINKKQLSKQTMKLKLFLPKKTGKPLLTLTMDQCWTSVSMESPDDIVKGSPQLLEMIEKMKNEWQLRQTLSIDGTHFEDLLVGQVLLGQQLRGMIVQVQQDQSLDWINQLSFLGTAQIYSADGHSDRVQAYLILKAIRSLN